MRIKLRARRHAYGSLAWAWEVYDPARPEGMQVIIGGAWYPSWDGACRAALGMLRTISVDQPVRVTGLGVPCRIMEA